MTRGVTERIWIWAWIVMVSFQGRRKVQVLMKRMERGGGAGGGQVEAWILAGSWGFEWKLLDVRSKRRTLSVTRFPGDHCFRSRGETRRDLAAACGGGIQRRWLDVGKCLVDVNLVIY